MRPEKATHQTPLGSRRRARAVIAGRMTRRAEALAIVVVGIALEMSTMISEEERTVDWGRWVDELYS